MKIEWLAVLRDVLLVASLGTFGTLGVLIVMGGASPLIQLVLAFVMLTIGFTISGCLQREGRLRHLLLVALGVWLVLLVDGAVRDPARVPGIVVVGTVNTLVAMLTGAGLSVVLRRGPSEPAPPVD